MIPLPYACLLGAILAALAGWWAYGAGQDAEIARRAREDGAVLSAVAQTQAIAASAIAGIKVFNAPIRERVEREVRTEPVYRDCVASPGVLRDINAALTGAGLPAGGVQLPHADPDGAGAVR